MKKIFFLAFLNIFLNSSSFSQNTFSLKVRMPYTAEGSKFILTLLDNDKRSIIFKDSSFVRSGSLIYTGKLRDTANFLTLTTRKNKSFLTTIVVVYSGDNQFSVPKLDYSINGWSKLDVLGSKAIEVQNVLDSIRNIYYERYANNNSKNPGVLAIRDLLAMNMAQMQVLKENNENYFALMMLYELSLYSHTIEYQSEIQKVFNLFSGAISQTPLGKDFSNNLALFFEAKKFNSGGKAPFFSAMKSNGISFDSDELNGKTYVLVFSATWCAPCQKELPILKEIVGKYLSKGLKVIYVNLDDDLFKWKKHIKDNHIKNWINLCGSCKNKGIKNDFSQKFGVYAIPTYFLVGADSKILYSSVGEKENKLAKLKELLKDVYK